jgi:hypothetical protein
MREVLVPILYRIKTSNPTTARTRTSLMVKESLMGRTSHHSLPILKRRLIRRKRRAPKSLGS